MKEIFTLKSSFRHVAFVSRTKNKIHQLNGEQKNAKKNIPYYIFSATSTFVLNILKKLLTVFGNFSCASIINTQFRNSKLRRYRNEAKKFIDKYPFDPL